LSKRAVLSSLPPGERWTVIPHLLALTVVRNTHGAMGLFGENAPLLVALAIVVLAVLALLLRELLQVSAYAQIGYGMVAGGALGNVIDRIVHGYVVDFIALPRFYVFNVADACITCGLLVAAVPARPKPKR
jgi:signal peptidase II